MNGWTTPLERPALEPGEAHIWMVRTDPEAIDIARWLHGLEVDERERAERFAHAAGRAGYVVARAALRSLLGSYMGVPASLVSLRRTATGKPVLAGDPGRGLRFSVAHSSGVALLSFATVDVGVDVERIRRVARAERIVARVFSEPMRARLAGIAEPDWLPAFFAAWTQREALVKAVGGVLMATRDPLDFEWPAGDSPRVFEEMDGGAARRWTVARLPQPAGYAAAFVAAGPITRLRLFLHGQDPPPPESADR